MDPFGSDDHRLGRSVMGDARPSVGNLASKKTVIQGRRPPPGSAPARRPKPPGERVEDFDKIFDSRSRRPVGGQTLRRIGSKLVFVKPEAGRRR